MSGALRGSSRQKHGAIINIVMYYVVGFPIAAFLAFYLEWGLIGLVRHSLTFLLPPCPCSLHLTSPP
jgi:Na+-driven multidrug efflux pump